MTVKIRTAAELTAAADMLDLALLAPSMKSEALRAEAARVAKQEEAAREYGRLARAA
jgi:hypothetical protein